MSKNQRKGVDINGIGRITRPSGSLDRWSTRKGRKSGQKSVFAFWAESLF